jgi:type IV pilus assembly protein PilV
MMRPQRPCAGFSLIEILVALVILGVGLMGLARLQLLLLAGTADTAAYDQAIRLANDQIEALRFARSSGIVPVTGADEQPMQAMTYQRSWIVDCSVDQACQTRVVVTWTAPGSDGQEARRELVLHAWLAPPLSAEQGWLVQSGPPGRETLP